jgi:hypothetical protein
LKFYQFCGLALISHKLLQKVAFFLSFFGIGHFARNTL